MEAECKYIRGQDIPTTNNVVTEESKDLSKQQIWEICKMKIREHTITYCKRKQHIKGI